MSDVLGKRNPLADSLRVRTLNQTSAGSTISDANKLGHIPVLFADPADAAVGDAWVLKTATFTGGGTPIGLLLALTGGTFTGWTRQLSIRDAEGVFRINLT